MTVLLPAWLQGGSYTAELDRQLITAAYTPQGSNAVRSGVLVTPSGPTVDNGITRPDGIFYLSNGSIITTSLRVTKTATASMAVLVNDGLAVLQGSYTSTQGAYVVKNDAPVTLAMPTADNFNPRIDLVVLEVLDQAYAGASNLARLRVVQGAAAPTPIAPVITGTYLILAEVRVAANATTLPDTVITDRRQYTSARGETVPCTSTTRPTWPYLGIKIYEIDTKRAYEWRGYWHLIAGVPPAVTMYRTGIGSIGANVWTNIGMDGTRGDPWGSLQGGGFYVVPLTGYYRFSGVISFGINQSGDRGTRFTLNNGTPIAGSSSVLSASNTQVYTVVPSPTVLHPFMAGDSIIMQAYQNGASSVIINGVQQEVTQNTFATYELAYQTG